MSVTGDSGIERKANKRDKAKQARGRRNAAAGTFTWEIFNWFAVIALTETLCKHGGALRVGFTRDGGAVALGVYLGDDYATEYIRPAEDFAEAVFEISEAWVPGSGDGTENRYRQLSGT